MNTLIYIWLKPIRNTDTLKKEYFNYVTKGDLTSFDKKYLEDWMGNQMAIKEIMDFADISHNFDFGIISVEKTSLPVHISTEVAPEEKEVRTNVGLVLSGKKDFDLTKESAEVIDGGLIKFENKEIGLNSSIDIGDIWKQLQKMKIKEGDEVTLKDDLGNIVFEILGGSYLSLVGAEMEIYDKEKLGNDHSFFNKRNSLIGGVYVRDDGSLDIGNIERTFYMKIYTKILVLASLKAKKQLSEITTKLLTKKK